MRKKSVFRGALLLSAAQGAIARDALTLGISEGTSGGPRQEHSPEDAVLLKTVGVEGFEAGSQDRLEKLLTWLGGSS